MGKRKKSSRATGGKKREPLSTTFTCVFCNHEKAINVKMDKKAGFGFLNCKVCGQKFQVPINYLDSPIDVYAGWIDACEQVAREHLGIDRAARRDQEAREAGETVEGGEEGEEGEEDAEEPATAADREFSNYGTRVDGANDDDDY